MESNKSIQSVRSIYISIFVLLTIPLAGSSLDISVASLPYMQQAFNTSRSMTQYTLGLFALGFAISQLIIGALSDVIGRKKLIVFGSFFNIACIISILWSSYIEAILILRFFQGVCTSIIIVPARAILIDTYQGIVLKKQLALIFIVSSFSIVASPFLGGFLQSHFGWRSCYTFMLLYTMAILISAITLLHDTFNKKRNVNFYSLYQSIEFIAKDTVFLRLALSSSILSPFIYVFHSIGTFFIQVSLQHSALQYGYCCLFIGLSALTGSLLNYLTTKNTLKFQLISFFLILLACLIMTLYAFFFQVTLVTFLIPCMTIILISYYTQSSIISMTLTRKTPYSGVASSLIWTAMWACNFLAVLICSQLDAGYPYVSSLIFFGLSFISLIIYISTIKKLKVLSTSTLS